MEFVRKDVACMIYKKLVEMENFRYDGTLNGQDARDVLLFRLKQEFGRLGYTLSSNANDTVVETTISLNLFACSM